MTVKITYCNILGFEDRDKISKKGKENYNNYYYDIIKNALYNKFQIYTNAEYLFDIDFSKGTTTREIYTGAVSLGITHFEGPVYVLSAPLKIYNPETEEFSYIKIPLLTLVDNQEEENGVKYKDLTIKDLKYYFYNNNENPLVFQELETLDENLTASFFYQQRKGKVTLQKGEKISYTLVLPLIGEEFKTKTICFETTTLFTPRRLFKKISFQNIFNSLNFDKKMSNFNLRDTRLSNSIVQKKFEEFLYNFSKEAIENSEKKIEENKIYPFSITLHNNLNSSQETIQLEFTGKELKKARSNLYTFDLAKQEIKKKCKELLNLEELKILSEENFDEITLLEHIENIYITHTINQEIVLALKCYNGKEILGINISFEIKSGQIISDFKKTVITQAQNFINKKQAIGLATVITNMLHRIQKEKDRLFNSNNQDSSSTNDYAQSFHELNNAFEGKIFYEEEFFESQKIEDTIDLISKKKEQIKNHEEKIKKSKDPELKSFLRNKIKKDEKCISSKKENLLKNKEEALTLALYSDNLYLSTKLPSENEYDKFEGDKFLILIIKENKESDLYSINKKTKKQQPIKMNISGEKTNFILEECSITNNNFENLKLSNEQLNVIELLIEYPLSNIKYNKELDDTNICFIDTIYAQKDFAKYTKIIEKANEEVENNNSNTPSFSPNLFDQNNGNLTNSDKELIEKKRAELEKNKKIAVSEEFKPKIKIGSSSSTGKIQKEIDHIDKFIEQKEIELANKKNNLKQLQEKQKTVKKLQIDINNINTHIQTMKDEVKKEEQDQDKLIQEKNIELRDIETENPLDDDIQITEKYVSQIDKINSDIKLKNYEINKKTNTLTKLQKNLEEEGNIEKLQTEIDETDNFIKQKEEELNKKKSEKRKLMEDSLKNDDENVEEELTDENLETKVRRIIKKYPLQDEEQIKEIEKKVNEKKDVIIQSYIEETEQWKKIRSANEFTKQKEIEITNKKNSLKQLQKKHETVKQLRADIDDINNFIKLAKSEIEKKQNEQNEELLNLKKNIGSQDIEDDPLAAKNETQFVEESALKHNKIDIDIRQINDELNKKSNTLKRLLKDLKEQGDIEKLQVEIDETDNFIKQKEEELNKKKTEKNESTKNKDESIKFTDEQIQIESSIEEDEFIKQKEIEINNEKDSLENKKVAAEQLQKNIDDINNVIQIAKSQIENKQNEHQQEVQNLKKKNDMQSMKELISKQNEINDYIKQKNNEIDKKEYKLEKFQKNLKELLTEIDNINNLIKQKEEEINKKQSEQTKPTKNKNESIQLTDENLELVEEQIQELENNDQYGMEFELDALLENEILSFIEKYEQNEKQELGNYIASLKNKAKLQTLQEAEIINKLLEEIQKACFNLRENNCSYEDAWDGVMTILRSEGKDSKVFVFFTKFIDNFEEEDKEKLNKIVNETFSQKKNCLIQ